MLQHSFAVKLQIFFFLDYKIWVDVEKHVSETQADLFKFSYRPQLLCLYPSTNKKQPFIENFYFEKMNSNL